MRFKSDSTALSDRMLSITVRFHLEVRVQARRCMYQSISISKEQDCGAWWLSGEFGELLPDSRRFESSSRHAETPSLVCSASARQLQHSVNAVVGSAAG